MSDSAACPACASTAEAGTVTVPEMMFGLRTAFEYTACGSCASLALMDVPTDYGPYYPDDYYSVELDPERILGRRPVRDFVRLVAGSALFGQGRVSGAARLALRKRQFQTLMSLLRSVKQAGLPSGRRTSVLDVGCGSGMLVYALGLAGMTDVTGIDPFAPADRKLDSGGTLVRSNLDDVDRSFELVMFHHSLEHVLDVEAALSAARSVLAPGGRVLVRMPTVSSDAFERYATDWVQLDAPRHVTLLSRPGVEAVSARAGLRVVGVRDDSTSFQFWGSEQIRRGIPLNDPRSHMVNPGASPFSRRQVRAWERSARTLNGISRGDQAAWVLAPT